MVLAVDSDDAGDKLAEKIATLAGGARDGTWSMVPIADTSQLRALGSAKTRGALDSAELGGETREGEGSVEPCSPLNHAHGP